jgi:hypothetical protein
VHDYKFPAGWHAQDFLLKGYFQGKRDAEAHMAAAYPTGEPHSPAQHLFD